MTVAVMFVRNNTPPTDIYTLSLHDALPILSQMIPTRTAAADADAARVGSIIHAHQGEPTGSYWGEIGLAARVLRSEEHTSELQSQSNLVCRLLLEKKKKIEP